MIAITELENCKQVFQCLRCGHEESRRVDVTGKQMLAANSPTGLKTSLLDVARSH